MGNWYIKHQCGHEVKHVLTVAEEKKGKAEWLETVVCPDCYAEIKRKEEEEKRAKKKEENQKFADGLPELEGSEKQIKWANDIRGAIACQWAELQKRFGEPPVEVGEYMGKVLNQTKAEYFIKKWKFATTRDFNLYDILIKNEKFGDAAFDWQYNEEL